VLHAAGLEEAALVIVALPDTDAAASAARAVRSLNAGAPLIARAHRPAEADELKRQGATAVVQPERAAAASVIRQALSVMQLPSASAVAYLERFRLAMDAAEAPTDGGALPEVREVALVGGPVAGQSLRQAQIRERYGVTVVVIRRQDGDMVLNPAPDAVLREGDRLRVFGLPEQIHAFRLAAESA
jgi:Trk K+ transport system NAD-binding subunit